MDTRDEEACYYLLLTLLSGLTAFALLVPANSYCIPRSFNRKDGNTDNTGWMDKKRMFILLRRIKTE